MDGQGAVGVIGGHGGASSPTSARNGLGQPKRKRSGAGFESSPGSVDVIENEEDEAERRRQPGVKRACNECRQQKVSQTMSRSRCSSLEYRNSAVVDFTY
jgi:hypothetical protein